MTESRGIIVVERADDVEILSELAEMGLSSKRSGQAPLVFVAPPPCILEDPYIDIFKGMDPCVDRGTDKTQVIANEVFDHISGKRSLRDEYELILNKKSLLSRRCRDYVVNIIENNKND